MHMNQASPCQNHKARAPFHHDADSKEAQVLLPLSKKSESRKAEELEDFQWFLQRAALLLSFLLPLQLSASTTTIAASTTMLNNNAYFYK